MSEEDSITTHSTARLATAQGAPGLHREHTRGRLAFMKYVVVGLGNPGAEYEGTRHNMGRSTVEVLRRELGATPWTLDRKSQARVSKTEIDVENERHTVTLVQPETFMNLSGEAVKCFIRGGIEADHLIVVHDDIDLPLGTVRVSFDRGSGGHHGVESVSLALGTKAYVRVRVGIIPIGSDGVFRKPPVGEGTREFILGAVDKDDSERLDAAAREAARIVRSVIERGMECAKNMASAGASNDTKKTL